MTIIEFFFIYKDNIAKLECLVKYYEDKSKEIHYTLQDCYDKNEKEKFKNLAWLLCSNRKITEHEKNELFEVINDWDYYKNNFPNRKIKYGYLGF